MQDEMTNPQWSKLADQAIVDKTIAALQANNINALSVATGEDAKKKVLELIPEGAEVMLATSVTLESIGINDAINSGNYNSVKEKLAKLDRNTQGLEMQKMGAAAEYMIGSVHAVTQEGHVFVASNSGSQLPGYSYGSSHVIWVVSTKKIVKDNEESLKRIYEHCVPLETVRARKAYGLPDDWHTFVSKLLIFNKEPAQGRITLIFVHEDLGF